MIPKLLLSPRKSIGLLQKTERGHVRVKTELPVIKTKINNTEQTLQTAMKPPEINITLPTRIKSKGATTNRSSSAMRTRL